MLSELIKNIEKEAEELNGNIQNVLYDLYLEYLDTVAVHPLKKGRFSLKFSGRYFNLKSECMVGSEYKHYVMQHNFDNNNIASKLIIRDFKKIIKGF